MLTSLEVLMIEIATTFRYFVSSNVAMFSEYV